MFEKLFFAGSNTLSLPCLDLAIKSRDDRQSGFRRLVAVLGVVSFFIPSLVCATGSDDESDTLTEGGRVTKPRLHTPSLNDTEEVSLHTAENSAAPDDRWKEDSSEKITKPLKKNKTKRAKRESLNAPTPTSTSASASTPSSLNVSSEAVEKPKGVEITIDVGALVDDKKEDGPNLQQNIPGKEDDCLRVLLSGVGAFKGLTTILSQVANIVSLHYSDLTTGASLDPSAVMSTMSTTMTTVTDATLTTMNMMPATTMSLTEYYGLVSVIAGGSSTVIQGLFNVAARAETRLQNSLKELIKEYNETEEELLGKIPAEKGSKPRFTLHLDDSDDEDEEHIQHTKKASNFMSRFHSGLIRFYGVIDGLVDWASWGCNTAGWIITAVSTFDKGLSDEQKTNYMNVSVALRATGIVLQGLPPLIEAEKTRLREELKTIKDDIARLNKSQKRRAAALGASGKK